MSSFKSGTPVRKAAFIGGGHQIWIDDAVANAMSEIKSSRARDYVTAKRNFRAGLVTLKGYMIGAGIQGSSLQLVQDLITMSTEAFIEDPEAHYPAPFISTYSGGMSRDRALENWEEKKFLPPNFANQAIKEFELVTRNRIRYENPEIPDEKISAGLHHQFPHLVKIAKM